VGGTGSALGYSGPFSGGSYPHAGRYPGSAFDVPLLSPADDTTTPARFLAAADFRIILLPEPARLDAAQSPELSWMRLPFHAGQRRLHRNLPLLSNFGGDRPPLQPAARHEWLAPARLPQWSRSLEGEALAQPWPAAWRCIAPLGAACGDRLASRR
jgi:hypothetical protein